MALAPDQHFSTFYNGGNLAVNDIVVGLRGGLNTQFIYTGEPPAGVIIPIANGGTGASTVVGALNNLGLGTSNTPQFAFVETAGINDSNGNPVITFVGLSTPVNYTQLVNAPTGSSPTFTALGTDLNIGFQFTTKGAGNFTINAATNYPLIINSGTAFQHVTNFNFANTANTRNVTFPDISGIIAYNSGVQSITPTLAFGGLSTGITYSINAGSYCQVGNVVTFEILIGLTSKGSATGNATITGLPIASAGSGIPIVPVSLVNIAFTNMPYGFVAASATVIQLLEAASGAGTAPKTDANFANNSQIYLSGSYLV